MYKRQVLESRDGGRTGLAALRQIHVATGDGQQVPLSSLARIEERPASLLINHIGQFPAVTLSFNLAPGVSLGQAVAVIERVEQEIGLPLSISTQFQGCLLYTSRIHAAHPPAQHLHSAS